LHQFRRVQLEVQFRLAGEDDAQHLVLGRLDPGQHPHFLQHLRRQVLRLVDDHQHLAVVGVLLDQELVQRGEDLRLLHLERLEAELDQQRLQELERRHLRLVDLRDDDVLVEFLQEGLDQRRLAGTDLARDDHEAVGEPDRRFHVRLGTRMVLRQVEELGIRAEPERKFTKSEQVQVHASDHSPGGTPSPAMMRCSQVSLQDITSNN
jgi:hypothetical protein